MSKLDASAERLADIEIARLEQLSSNARKASIERLEKIAGVNMPIVEIRAAEGGKDAELLVEDQFSIYAKVVERRGL